MARLLSDDALPRLWPERLEETGLFEDIEAVVGQSPPTWEDIEEEGAVVRREIEAGQRSWPPTTGMEAEILRLMGRNSVVPETFDPRNFVCFLSVPSITRILSGLCDVAGLQTSHPLMVQMLATTAHELFHVTRWRHFGRRVYAIQPRTFELLSRTDLPALPAGHLRAPLPSFYVRFPDGAFSFDVTMDPEAQPAEGVLVSFDEAAPRPGRNREMSLLITGASAKGPEDDNVAYVSAAIGPETPLSDIVLPNAENAVHREGGGELGVLVPRAVLGLCLYLQSEHPELEPIPAPPRRDPRPLSPKKRRRVERANRQTSRLNYIRVGSRAEAEDGLPSAGDQEGSSLDHQVWVRGHWRWQAHGPEYSLRKLIWIQPHLRGPDLAETERAQISVVPPAQRRRDES